MKCPIKDDTLAEIKVKKKEIIKDIKTDKLIRRRIEDEEQKRLREKFKDKVRLLDSPVGFDRTFDNAGRVHYSREEAIFLLDQIELEGNIAKVGKLYNIPYDSLFNIVKNKIAKQDFLDIKDLLRRYNMGAIYKAIDLHLHNMGNEAKAESISPVQSATIFGILIDKLGKLLGDPDTIIKTYNQTDVREIKVIIDGIKENPDMFNNIFNSYREAKGIASPVDNA